jgi:hypothetical protein
MSTRLPEPWGQLIDRQAPMQFTFEGRSIDAFDG